MTTLICKLVAGAAFDATYWPFIVILLLKDIVKKRLLHILAGFVVILGLRNVIHYFKTGAFTIPTTDDIIVSIIIAVVVSFTTKLPRKKVTSKT